MLDGRTIRISAVQDTDVAVSLRTRHERPGGHRATENRHKIPSPHYSITSSARAATLEGISSPIVFAVLRLITKMYRVGCSTGRSAGLAPLNMLSTSAAARAKDSRWSAP